MRRQWQNLARGWNRELGKLVGGIESPHEAKVRKGTFLYRFGRSAAGSDRPSDPDDGNLASAWWLSYETARHIWCSVKSSIDRAAEQPCLRSKLALAIAFGALPDRVYRIRLEGSLRAWTGRGRPVRESDAAKAAGQSSDDDTCWFAGFEVNQIFIPGIAEGRPPKLTCVGRRGFANPAWADFDSWGKS